MKCRNEETTSVSLCWHPKNSSAEARVTCNDPRDNSALKTAEDPVEPRLLLFGCGSGKARQTTLANSGVD